MPCTNFIGPITPILISCPKAIAEGDTANKKTLIKMIIPLPNLFICHSSFLFFYPPKDYTQYGCAAPKIFLKFFQEEGTPFQFWNSIRFTALEEKIKPSLSVEKYQAFKYLLRPRSLWERNR
jgi:hypothetical protein